MTIITVSRGSYSQGSRIAEGVAERLGCECVSRDVLLEASEEFHVPEVKLEHALHDAPSILDRFRHGREECTSFIRAALLERMLRDNVVYHGLAGHFLVAGIPHVLKVRIVADHEDRVRLEMERKGLSAHAAERLLVKDDHERRKWSQTLYGVDTADPSLYDLVLHIRKLTSEDAVGLICHAAGLPQFQTTPASQAALGDLLLAARAESAIVHRWPHAEVSAHAGTVVVRAEATLAAEGEVRAEITALCGAVPGAREVRVDLQLNSALG